MCFVEHFKNSVSIDFVYGFSARFGPVFVMYNVALQKHYNAMPKARNFAWKCAQNRVNGIGANEIDGDI